jgi:hypothetical protein
VLIGFSPVESSGRLNPTSECNFEWWVSEQTQTQPHHLAWKQ